MTCSHCPFPDQDDERIFLAPGTLGKSFQGRKGFFSRRSPIDRFEFGHNRFTVFPSGVFQGITDQVNHAGLNLGQGEHGGDRFRKSFQPIDYRNQNVADPTVSDLGDHSEPELRSLALLDPDPQNVLGPVGSRPQSRTTGARSAYSETFCSQPVRNHF